jgi:hypothetical protein
MRLGISCSLTKISSTPTDQMQRSPTQAMSSRGRADIDPQGGQPYSAAAMSLVFHAAHPLVPTLRADVRLFQVGLLARLLAFWTGFPFFSVLSTVFSAQPVSAGACLPRNDERHRLPGTPGLAAAAT